ncbi:MAG: hypothetical protein GY822_31845 [Deltaproteobacteria bacterium]|nr:hypothetical protein [Deltaproteobacteria bacterium]
MQKLKLRQASQVSFRFGGIALVFFAQILGCAPAPRDECVAYLECVAHFDDVMDTGGTGGLDAYDTDGSCWRTPQTRESCTKACVASVKELGDLLEENGVALGACES